MNFTLPTDPASSEINENAPKTEIEAAISKGLDYLEDHQFPNGEFCCFMSGDDPMQGWTHHETMLFPTMLVCQSLLYLPQTEQVKNMTIQAGWFLRYFMERGGVWSHCTPNHPYYYVFPLDVDCTASIADLLKALGIDFPEASCKKMMLANRNRKGLFYTWFTLRFAFNPMRHYWRLALRELIFPIKSFLFWTRFECAHNDIDAVVNANVLCYLGEAEETKPVVNWLLQIIKEGKETKCDKWYCTPTSVYYFISHCIAIGIKGLEPIRETMISRILALRNNDGSIAVSALETALNMCSLINLEYTGEALAQASRHLAQTQQKRGNWPRWRLYYGGPKMLSGYGSEELSTAFCLQALSRYLQQLAAEKV